MRRLEGCVVLVLPDLESVYALPDHNLSEEEHHVIRDTLVVEFPQYHVMTTDGAYTRLTVSAGHRLGHWGNNEEAVK